MNNSIPAFVDEYLEYKRSLGFKLTSEEDTLRSFAQYTISSNHNGTLTTEIVLEWASSNTDSDKTMGRRIEAIRPFSKYVRSFDENAEIIHSLIYKNVHDRPTPYIYSEEEATRLMDECRHLYSPDGIRAYSIETVIGLLWSTGLRPSEPVNLNIEDVDLDRNLLYIHGTKFSKERIVPIYKTVGARLSAYKQWIEHKLGTRHPSDPFFYTTGGRALTREAIRYAFSLIRSSIEATPTGYPQVRLYDFRHTFATNTIKKWIDQGIDANAKLHVLSTYLGHVKPEDTFWYLSATPELLQLTCSRYESLFGGDIDEV